MTKEQLYQELSRINASRESRLQYAQLIKNDTRLFPDLLDIMFMVNDKVSCHAAWVFEFVCTDYIYGIIPQLDTFTKNIRKIRFESAIRPSAKVCEYIAKAYCSKEDHTFKKLLKPEHKERIVETCFDWMINDHKVATKAYAMETLFLFGKETNWVHNELAQIIARDFHTQSAAFKSRAKRILQKIKKKDKS